MQEALGKWWGYTTVGTHTQEDKEESSSALSLHREKKRNPKTRQNGEDEHLIQAEELFSRKRRNNGSSPHGSMSGKRCVSLS
jgi:hypothetical protein